MSNYTITDDCNSSLDMFEMIHSSQKQIKYSVPLDISSPGEREKEKIIIKKIKPKMI